MSTYCTVHIQVYTAYPQGRILFLCCYRLAPGPGLGLDEPTTTIVSPSLLGKPHDSFSAGAVLSWATVQGAHYIVKNTQNQTVGKVPNTLCKYVLQYTAARLKCTKCVK
jgi:hypothetical protein